MEFSSPVRPRLLRLPFYDPAFSWESFEDFCLAYIGCRADVLPESAHFYGTRGSKQKGIDIFADMVSGERWAFQCRHWKRITAGNVRAAISETTYSAQKYVILVTCDATTEARDECDRHPNWEIWDGRDIAHRMRELPSHSQSRLLDTYFGPQIRREFLGLHGVKAFCHAEDFFANTSNPAASFNHCWTLVGRADELEQFFEFVEGDKDALILSGRGGAGKSRLAYALAERWHSRFPAIELRFLTDGVSISPEFLDEIPVGPCVVVVDDAHRAGNLRLLLAAAAQRRRAGSESSNQRAWLKIILLVRPHGVAEVQSTTRMVFGAENVVRLPELKDLSTDQVRTLAADALGSGNDIHAARLAALTADCPLVTTVGGRLLATGAVSFYFLEPSEEFRGEVLDRFRDEVLGHVEGIDSEFAKLLLNLSAAIAPVKAESTSFLDAMADFLDVTRARVLQGLEALESAGILVRRGGKLRILPDVLSDHILHRACISSSGISTGFGENIVRKFFSVWLPNIVKNLAELDWRVRTIQKSNTGILDEFWARWKSDFYSAPEEERRSMLEIVAQIAGFQASHSLELAEAVLEQRDGVVDEVVGRMLRGVAYDEGFTLRCFHLLWQHGRNDSRPENQFPEHPIRVLRELAGYDIDMGVPSFLNAAALTASEQWIESPDAFSYVHSPLLVAEALLAKTATSDLSFDFQITMRAFVVDQYSTRELRERAFACIEKAIRSGCESAVLQAVDICEKVAHGPNAYYGMEISEERALSWVPEQRRALDLMAEAVSVMPTAFVILDASESLSWHLQFARWPDLRCRAREIFVALPDPFDCQLLRCLTWHDQSDYAKAYISLSSDLDELGETIDDKVQMERRDEIEQERFENVLAEFLEWFPDPEQGMAKLLSLVQEGQARHIRGDWDGAGRFIFRLARRNTEYAVWTCENVLANPESSFRGGCVDCLLPLRDNDFDLALDLCRRFSESEHEILQRIAASVYQGRAWKLHLQEEDWPILDRLSRSPFLSVRTTLIRALRWPEDAVGALSVSQKQRLLDLLLSCDLEGNSEATGRWLASFVGSHANFPLAGFNEAQWTRALQVVEVVSSLDDHHISTFLAEAARSRPKQTIGLLLRRLDSNEVEGRRPVPYLYFDDKLPLDLSGLADAPEYEEIVQEFVERMASVSGSKSMYLASLFRLVSLDYSARSLAVLEEQIGMFPSIADASKVCAVADLVSQAQAEFVLRELEFVRLLLRASHFHGRDCYSRVGGSLARSAISGMFTRAISEPAPQHIRQRDASLQIASMLDLGSPEREFYEWLAHNAEAEIQNGLRRDEELYDGR